MVDIKKDVSCDNVKIWTILGFTDVIEINIAIGLKTFCKENYCNELSTQIEKNLRSKYQQDGADH